MPEAILLQDVETLGERGAVVDVSKGYLRNYLVPRKLAQPATKGAIEAVRRRQEATERAARNAVEQVDYKDIASLRKFVSEKGKIRSRRITGACRRHQVQIARAVKRARELALMPYVNEGGRDDSPRRERGDRDRDR